jgi:hypothetical protein
MMKEPPDELDGAKVLYWAWSGDEPFFVMSSSDGQGGIEIFGLAVCQYKNGATYRFYCDASWEVENDTDHDTVEWALRELLRPYDITKVDWHKK